MSAADFFYVLKRILISPYVIGIAIAVTLFLQLFFYVANYNKRQKTIRIRRLKKPSPPKEQPEQKTSDDGAASEEENE
ncbi:hypothetical protein [Treponema pedis]|uniref:Uncharacterized protein n=2 Tax=Treponema pedis TaxID=409322 RepID=S5ZS89_9SPIR|nr:hypothetical protein [Treponema pedis]AGT42935.1 hypothetical protein TPE_0439 [Treponema pedis str. T A4]QOW61556.1 hypothetical protein IFE08_03985 [Treponema pedis]QSI03791.1 hypothetical protein DYQ05_02080 [Treponema pedis]